MCSRQFHTCTQCIWTTLTPDSLLSPYHPVPLSFLPMNLSVPPVAVCYVLWPTQFNQGHLGNYRFEDVLWRPVGSANWQKTKGQYFPLSQNLSIANNSALRHRTLWVPPSMTYCQQTSLVHDKCRQSQLRWLQGCIRSRRCHFSALHPIFRPLQTFWPLFHNVSWAV